MTKTKMEQPVEVLTVGDAIREDLAVGDTQTVVELQTIAERCGELHRGIEGAKGNYEEIRGLLLQVRESTKRTTGFMVWLKDNEAVLGFESRQAYHYLAPTSKRTSNMKKKSARDREDRAIAPR